MNIALESFVKTHAEDFVLHRRRMLMEVEKIINPLLAEVKKIDAKFDFELINRNSFYVFKSPSHLEVLLIFQGIDPGEISIEDGQTPAGFSLARLTGKKMVSRWKCCSGNSNPSKVYMSAKIVKEKVFELVKRVVHDVPNHRQQEGKVRIAVNEACDSDTISLLVSGHDAEPFSLDLVPAIPCPGRWVFSAHAWESKLADWANKKLKEELMRSGIHLAARPSPSKSGYQWQIDFPGPMTKLLELDMGCRTKCLLILEILMENMQSCKERCDSFQLETLVIQVTEKFPITSFWSDEKLSKRFLDIMKELQRCLLVRSLSHIFLPNVNLFRDVDKLALESWEECVDKVLSDPEKFLNTFELFKYTTSL